MKAMTTPRSKDDNRPTEVHQTATLGDIERHDFGLQMGPGSGLLLVLRRSASEPHQPEETPMKTLMAITCHAATCFTHFDVPIGCGSQTTNSSIGTTKNDNMQNHRVGRQFYEAIQARTLSPGAHDQPFDTVPNRTHNGTFGCPHMAQSAMIRTHRQFRLRSF